MDSLGEGYDFGSIMHYARNTFSRWAWNKHLSGNLLLLFFCSKQTWQPQQWGGLNLHCHTTCPPFPRARCCPLLFSVFWCFTSIISLPVWVMAAGQAK